MFELRDESLEESEFVIVANDNHSWTFRLGQINRTIFWRAEGLG